jgi:hypothetical protein
MAHVKPKNRQVVNLTPGEVSYITLANDDGNFTSTTEVLTAQDTDNGLEWDAEVVKQKPKELRIRLTAKAAVTAKAVTAKKEGKSVKGGTVPDSGNLTVTITSPVKPVDPVPVDYVNDSPP